jgi:hypothetical protein
MSGLQDSWLDAEDPATLTNLERALERATAVMALSGARANAVTMYAVASGATAATFDTGISQGVTMQTYEATGQQDILVSRLTVRAGSHAFPSFHPGAYILVIDM